MRRRTIVRLGGAGRRAGGAAAGRFGGCGAIRRSRCRCSRRGSPGSTTAIPSRWSSDSGHARVRLSAIDTPEYDQPYGAQSSAALKAMLPVGSTVELEVVTQDQFHRMVATVWLVDGDKRININEAMLRQGHAWAYRRYMKDPKFCDMEQEARVEEVRPVGAAGERLGLSARVALPQERRDPRAARRPTRRRARSAWRC